MRSAVKRRPAAQKSSNTAFPMHVLPAVLVVYACMLPRELTFEIASVAFQPFRVLLTLLLPYLFYQATQHRFRASVIDIFALFAAVWFVVSLLVTESFQVAMISGLSEGLNFALAYFVGRTSLRSSRDFTAFAYAVLPGLFVCSILMAIESVLHRPIVRPFFSRLTGSYSSYLIETRLGLMRATGPFVHPILGGVFLASFLPIIWYLVNKPFQRIIGLIGVGGFFFSLSSTGFLGIIVGGGLIFTNFLQRVTRLPVFPAVVGASLFMMVFIEIFSGAGVFSFIIRRLTFSSGTGYYRMEIWNHAGADAMNHPVFGVGLRSYIRPAWMISPSVDAHWLLLALRHGLPLTIAVFITMTGSAVMSLRGAWSAYALEKQTAYAIGFALIAIIFTGLSVYLWEGMGIWMTILTGMGVTFGQLVANRAKGSERPQKRPLTPTRRPGPSWASGAHG